MISHEMGREKFIEPRSLMHVGDAGRGEDTFSSPSHLITNDVEDIGLRVAKPHRGSFCSGAGIELARRPIA